MNVRKSLVAVIASVFVSVPASAALITTPNLQSISFTEGTGGPFVYTFSHTGSQMINRFSGPLGGSGFDFPGLSNEFYDVFYSDANGAFNVFGDFISIEARYPTTTGGGGLNISLVQLNFFSGPSLTANVLASFNSLGSSNYVPGSELFAVDGNPGTFTQMGNTGNSDVNRLRVTVGFRAVPEPGSLALVGLGLVALAGFARRRAT